MRKSILMLVPAAALVVAGAVACNPSTTDNSTKAPAATSSAPAKDSGVSSGLGTKNASGDVALGAFKTDQFGYGQVPVTVTNHSSKRSTYIIQIALTSPDGSQQYATADSFVDNLEPGQSHSEDASFLKDNLPANGVLKLLSVQRNESF